MGAAEQAAVLGNSKRDNLLGRWPKINNPLQIEFPIRALCQAIMATNMQAIHLTQHLSLTIAHPIVGLFLSFIL